MVMTGFDVLGDADPEDRNPKPEQPDSPLVEAVIPHRVHVVAPVVERPRRASGPLVCRRWAPAQGRRTLAVVPPVVVVPVVPVFAEREARPVDVEERYVVTPGGAVEVTLTTRTAAFTQTFRLARRAPVSPSSVCDIRPGATRTCRLAHG